ncbi:MAG: hypothetical protein WCL23_04415 [Candidatus Moraniibacteriota bacterium]
MKLDTRQTKIIGLAAVFIFIFVLITLLVDVFIKSDSQKIGFQRNTSDTEHKVETATTEAPIPAENSSDSIEKLPDYRDLEIDASLMKDPTALMLAIDGDGSDRYDNGLITKWMNAGTVPLGEKRPAGETVSHRIEEAAKFDDVYIKALLIDGWESNPNLVAWVNLVKSIHEDVVTFNFATSNGLPGDNIPYRRGVKVKVIFAADTLDDGSMKLKVRSNDYDETNNRVSTQFGGGVTGQDNDVIFTVVNQGGKVRIFDHVVAK